MNEGLKIQEQLASQVGKRLRKEKRLACEGHGKRMAPGLLLQIEGKGVKDEGRFN